MTHKHARESQQRSSTQKNEGEGSRTAARHYNEATQRYVESGRVDDAAKKAEQAIEGPEGEELRKAEEEGKRRAAVREGKC